MMTRMTLIMAILYSLLIFIEFCVFCLYFGISKLMRIFSEIMNVIWYEQASEIMKGSMAGGAHKGPLFIQIQ